MGPHPNEGKKKKLDKFLRLQKLKKMISDFLVEGLKQNSYPDLNKNVIQGFMMVPSSSWVPLSGETKSSNLLARKIFL